MYLRAAKTEAEEAGESTDGMANSVSELREEILDLTGQQVDIQIDDDTFKSTYQILEELSKVWDDLTDVSQANLLELIGGKRNANVVSALLENFSVAEEALKSSMGAAGSAIAENEKHLDSIQGKLAEFKAQFESFSTTIIESEFVKGAVEFGTTMLQILEVVGKVINALGGLSNVLTTIAGVILTIKAQSIVDRFASIAYSIKNLTFLTGTFGTTFKQCFDMARLDGANSLKATLTGISGGFTEVAASASTAAIAIGAFTAIIAVINILKNAIEKARQETIQLNEELYEKYNAELENTEQLKNAYRVYDDYHASLEHTAAEETAYQEAVKTITALLSDKNQALGYLTDGTERYTEALRDQIDAELDAALITAKQQKRAAQDALAATSWSAWDGSQVTIDLSGRTGIEEFVEAYKVAEEIMGEYFDEGTNGIELEPIGWDADHTNMDALTDYYYKLIELRDRLTELDDGENNMMNNDIYDDANSIINELESSVNKYVEARFMQSLAEHEADKGIIQTTEDLSAFRDTLLSTFDSVPENKVDAFLSSSGYDKLLSELYKTEYELESRANRIREISESIANNKIGQDYTQMFTGNEQVQIYKDLLTKYQNVLSELSDEDIAIAGIVINERDIKNIDELIAAVERYKEVAESASGIAKNKLQSLWDSEDFAKSKEELVSLSQTVDGISPEKIEELAAESEELASILELDGMNASFLANILTALGKGYDGISLITDDALKLNDVLNSMSDAFDGVTEAKSKYDEAMSVSEKDENFKSYAEAYATLLEQIEAGTTNSNAFWASSEYLFGADKLAEWGYSDGIEQIKSAADGLSGIFEDADSAGAGLIYTLYEMSEAGELVNESGERLIEISRDAEGGFIFDVDPANLPVIADKLNTTEDALVACFQALSMWGHIDFFEAEDVIATLEEIGFAVETSGKKAVNVTRLTEQLYTLGLTSKDVYDVINALQSLDGGVTLLGVTDDVNTLTTSLVDLGLAADDGVTVSVNYEGLLDLMSQLGFTKDEAQATIGLLGEADGIKLTNASGEVKSVNDALAHIDTLTFANVTASVSSVTDAVSEVDNSSTDNVTSELDSVGSAADTARMKVYYLGSALDSLDGKSVTVYYDVQSRGSTLDILGFARGTSDAPGGPAVVGEEGPELQITDGAARVVGSNGPEIVHVNPGDRIYTADETKAIMRRSGRVVHGVIPAYFSGKLPYVPKPSSSTGGLSGGSYSTENYNSYSNSSSSKKSDEESWFERQYKDHQHWLEMDKESVSDYLDWLDDAYQKAYNEGVIDLDEYYKYQEEVYKGVQDLFKDHLNDIEHEISLLESGVGNSDEIINLSLKAIESIEKEIEAAYAAGLDNNGEYIQYLKNQWADYSQTIIDLREKAESESESTIDDLVEYRIDMLKTEIEEEKEALDKKLSDLQDFYDRQRKMLQDQHDEEKYLEEQAEKRKSITDIRADLAMLSNDNSAWAQKRKLELQAELADAEKELNSFEKDHALEATLNLLDEQQSAEEAKIQAEMDALDKKLNDPHALFNEALNDIKNNTAELYQEFIAYNRQHGTGNDKDIADMWENAYKADLEYQETHNGDHSGDITIGNYTGYTPPTNLTPPEGKYPSQSPSGTTGESKSPSLEKGSTVQVKKSATHFGPSSGGLRMASFVPGGTYTVYDTSGSEVLIGLNGAYTGWVNKSDIVGYKHGTAYSIGGLAEFDEEGRGSEYIFESSDGSRYRMFGEGSKVLNADATQFLYDFATSGGGILMKMLTDLFGPNGLGNIAKPVQAVEIHSGDIIIQGNATERTVSEIRRAQRESLKFVITEFNKLNK